MKYSEEFRQDAVAVVRAGATQREVCRDLGIWKSAMSKWVADADDVRAIAADDDTAANRFRGTGHAVIHTGGPFASDGAQERGRIVSGGRSRPRGRGWCGTVHEQPPEKKQAPGSPGVIPGSRSALPGVVAKKCTPGQGCKVEG